MIEWIAKHNWLPKIWRNKDQLVFVYPMTQPYEYLFEFIQMAMPCYFLSFIRHKIFYEICVFFCLSRLCYPLGLWSSVEWRPLRKDQSPIVAKQRGKYRSFKYLCFQGCPLNTKLGQQKNNFALSQNISRPKLQLRGRSLFNPH